MWLGTTYSKLIDGSEYVNIGIAPNVIADRSAEDIADGRDCALIKALEFLRNRDIYLAKNFDNFLK